MKNNPKQITMQILNKSIELLDNQNIEIVHFNLGIQLCAALSF